MPENFTPLSLALVAGVFYGLSALFSKRALETGAGTFRSLVWSNWAITLAFVPFPFLSDRSIEAEALLPGMLLGVIFFFAQMACFLALRRSDASVVTSVIGSKSLFVAFFLVLLGFRESLPGKIWIDSQGEEGDKENTQREGKYFKLLDLAEQGLAFRSLEGDLAKEEKSCRD